MIIASTFGPFSAVLYCSDITLILAWAFMRGHLKVKYGVLNRLLIARLLGGMYEKIRRPRTEFQTRTYE